MTVPRHKISLTFLLVVSLIGTLLRTPGAIPTPFEYANLVHAHSHVAFQGWIYTMMMLLLMGFFLSDHQIQIGRYALQFKLTVLVIIGVLISFSLQGYALYSIIFSCLFQLLNYWFIYRFFRDAKNIQPKSEGDISLRFVKTGLWLGLISTLVPLTIGFASSRGLGGTEVYHSLVYTFLHLQYNGWFLFVAIGLFYKYLEYHHISYHRRQANRFYWLFTIGVLPAITLSLLGMSFSKLLTLPAYLTAACLGMALVYFVMSLTGSKAALSHRSSWFQIYLALFIGSFTLKTLLQSLSVLPVFRSYAFYNKQIILAYLHLSLIGVISFLFLALMIELWWLGITRISKLGNALLVLGFLSTEILLTSGGLGWASNPVLLSIGSGIMALGILLLILSKKGMPGFC